MILLISASPAAPRMAALLHERLGETVQVADSVKRARVMARSQPPAAVVVDESSVDSELAALDLMASEGAVSVIANLVIHDGERIAREVKLALRRVERERVAAAEMAARLLRMQLKDELTGILLSSELALAVPELPPTAANKIKQVVDAARRMRQRLGA